MRKVIFPLLGVVVIILAGCSESTSIKKEGNITVRLMVADTSWDEVNQDYVYRPLEGTKVSLYSATYDERFEGYTDENGLVTLNKVLAAFYEVTVIDTLETQSAYPLVVYATLNMDLTGYSDSLYQDTLIVQPVSSSPIVINELFYAGSPTNYFYDQFVELYNPTTSVQYLDGLIIARILKDDSNYGIAVRATSTYQFPGTAGGNQYPIQPGQFVVIATDAMNHATETNPNPLNLENADWEFFTEFDSRPDFDNEAVPNVVNINPNKGTEFLMNLKAGAVVLASSTGYDLTPAEDGYIYIPYSAIIDGVEYSDVTLSSKIVSEDIDAGYAGLGMVRFSQQSIERIQPGFDTDNSSHDFRIVTPTPGSHHSVIAK